MNNFEKAIKLVQKIEANEKLKALELDGFVNGEIKGKAMKGVTKKEMYNIIENQIADFRRDYYYSEEKLLKTLADLRNVCGLMFLLIDNSKQFEEV